MGLASKLRDLLSSWPDPYEYECTVCGRSFNAEQPRCPDCGGTVEVAAGDAETPADPQP